MIAIVKVKIKNRTNHHVENASVVWLYKSLEEALHKGSGVTDGSMARVGYKLMRSGKDADQYSIDLSFIKKDITYESIEKAIRPLVRDKLLNDILN